MIDPIELLTVPDEIVRLFYDLETEILKDIAERLAANDYLMSPTTKYQLKKLRELGVQYDTVVRMISKILNVSEEKVEKAITETSLQNINSDNQMMKEYDLFSNAEFDAGQLKEIMMKGIRQTNGEMANITKSMAAHANKTFEIALDNAYMKVRSGAYSYSEAIKTAVDDLASKGIETFTYRSGKREQVSTVVRRAVLTGVNKTSIETQLQNLVNMGMNLVRTTQHLGARPEHELWQGKTFYYGKPVEGYQSLQEGTGYGTGAGLGGWNCRHGIRIALEELGIPYTEPPIDTEENNRIYQLEQQQRYNERKIREWKRRKAIKQAGDQDAGFETRKVKEWEARQEQFIKENPELKRQFNREGISRKVSSVPKFTTYDFSKGEMPPDFRKYSDTEIRNITSKNEEILNEIFPDIPSKWNGSIKYVDAVKQTGMSFDGELMTSHETSPHILIHEQIHARSANYFDLLDFKKNRIIEESSVQFLTQEISLLHNYSIIEGGWNKYADVLRKINSLAEISESNYKFAIELIKQPMINRLDWLESVVYDKMMSKNDMDLMAEAIELVDLLREV